MAYLYLVRYMRTLLIAVAFGVAVASVCVTQPENANYRLPATSSPSAGCIDDTWTSTSITNVPEARGEHTAVWTGAEMIVWGGATASGVANTGGRYNPATDTWTATSTTNAPDARYSHTEVWTGSEMIVWGGADNFGDNVNTGGRYNPDTDGWTPTSTPNAPSARARHTAVWTGSEMIVWGGADSNGALNTGSRYNPSMNAWTATSGTNVPEGRSAHTAVWTGSEMIVWGGADSNGALNTGSRYNPSMDSWTATSTTNVPSARASHTTIWTGSEMMIVWGGSYFTALDSGGRYCAQSGVTPTPTPSPAGCSADSPACGSIIVGTAPTDFIINLSAPAGGAQGSDFTVNGTPANGSYLIKWRHDDNLPLQHLTRDRGPKHDAYSSLRIPLRRTRGVCVGIHLHVHLPGIYADPDAHSDSYSDAQVATDTKVSSDSARASVGLVGFQYCI